MENLLLRTVAHLFVFQCIIFPFKLSAQIAKMLLVFVMYILLPLETREH